MSPHTTDFRCSFCAKPKGDIAKMIAGPGIYICNECVDLCVDILGNDALAGEHGQAEPQIQPWESMTDDAMLALLPKIAAVGDQVEDSLRGWVTHLRSRGVTWAAIGTAMGMTRQSAWGRFSGEE
jgi:hypothetical protein